MKKFPKLNNKGFAVSVILYAAIVLIVLILFLILSILATITKNKIQLVDSIKEEASGNLLNKSESLGELTIVSSDEVLTNSWHKSDFTLHISTSIETSFPVQYYYGLTENDVNTEIIDNEIAHSNNTIGTTYYFKACRDANKEVCTKVVSYLVKEDKNKPVLELNTSETKYIEGTPITFKIVPQAISNIDYYQYYVSNFSSNPHEDDDLQRVDGRLVDTDGSFIMSISEQERYIFVRGISNSGLKSDWYKIDCETLK